MLADQRYDLSNPPVIAELIEGEVIAVNLDSGSYYSLRGNSARIWNLLLEGHSAGEIARGFASNGSGGDSGGAIEVFVKSLVAEGLIRPAQGNRPIPAGQAEIGPWAAEELRFERFSDMQELLLLDPIHEIDEEIGWPKPSP